MIFKIYFENTGNSMIISGNNFEDTLNRYGISKSQLSRVDFYRDGEFVEEDLKRNNLAYYYAHMDEINSNMKKGK